MSVLSCEVRLQGFIILKGTKVMGDCVDPGTWEHSANVQIGLREL
jgi:hypothetical protein